MEDDDLTLNVPVGTGDGEGMGLGAAIKERLTESIQNMDLLNVLQKMVATTPEDEESEEVRDKLRGVLEQFSHMTEEEKVRVTQQIKEGLANKLSMRLQDSPIMGNLEEAMRSAIMTKLYMVAAGVLLLIFLLGMFLTNFQKAGGSQSVCYVFSCRYVMRLLCCIKIDYKNIFCWKGYISKILPGLD